MVLITDIFRVNICSMSERPCEFVEKDMLMDWGHLSSSAESHYVDDDTGTLHPTSTPASQYPVSTCQFREYILGWRIVLLGNKYNAKTHILILYIRPVNSRCWYMNDYNLWIIIVGWVLTGSQIHCYELYIDFLILFSQQTWG